jgi:hypothetical protein
VVGDEAEQALAAEFANVARRYLAVIDGRDGQSPEDFLVALHPLLCELTYRAAMLPDVEPEAERPTEDRMTQVEWNRLFQSLEALLGKYNLYWHVFDPVELDKDDPIYGGLADDLADIYWDVAAGLEPAAGSAEHIPAHVIWTWRFQFYSHWGFHALEATRAIHCHIGYHELDDSVLYGDDDEGDEEEGA